MSRDRFGLNPDVPGDGAAADALNVYLDAVAGGRRTANGPVRVPDRQFVATDRRLRALDAPDTPPAEVKARIWEGLMATATGSPPTALPATNPNGFAPVAPTVAIPAPSERRRGRAIVPALEVAAAVLLLLSFAGLIGSLRDREDAGGDLGAVASSSPGAVGSPAAGVRPVHLRIVAADVDAPVEPVADAGLSLPFPEAGPWTVLWDERSGHLGEPSNVLLVGHLDYYSVGPAVFWDLRHVAPGALIEVTGSDGAGYVYAVDGGQTYPVEELPIESILGPTDAERLTLVSETGVFDFDLGEYTELLVIRATRIESAEATPAQSR